MTATERERQLNQELREKRAELSRTIATISDAGAVDDESAWKRQSQNLGRLKNDVETMQHVLDGVRRRRIGEMKAAYQKRVDELRSEAEAKRTEAARIRSKSRDVLQKFLDLEWREAAPGAMLLVNENFNLAGIEAALRAQFALKSVRLETESSQIEAALRAQFALKSVRLETESSHILARADGMNVEEIPMEGTTDASNLEEILAAIYDPKILGPRESDVMSWFEAMMGELNRRGQHGHQLRWRVAWAKGELDMGQSSCEIIIPARADLNLRSSVRILRFNGTEFSDNQHAFGWSADRVWDVAEVRTVA